MEHAKSNRLKMDGAAEKTPVCCSPTERDHGLKTSPTMKKVTTEENGTATATSMAVWPRNIAPDEFCPPWPPVKLSTPLVHITPSSSQKITHTRGSNWFDLFLVVLRNSGIVGNIALLTKLPVLGCLNLVQHLQPRCLEDRFLP